MSIFLRNIRQVRILRQDDIPEDDDLGDGQGGGIIGRDDDSQVPDQSILHGCST